MSVKEIFLSRHEKGLTMGKITAHHNAKHNNKKIIKEDNCANVKGGF